MLTSLAVAVISSALLLSGPPSQGAPRGQDQAPWQPVIELPQGTLVRLTVASRAVPLERGFRDPAGHVARPHARRLEGRVIRADQDALTIDVSAGAEKGVWRLPRAAVRRIDRGRIERDPIGDGLLKGMLVGAGLAACTYVGFSGTSEAFDPDELPALMAGFGAQAGMIGVLTDYVKRGETFVAEATVYDTVPGRAASPSPDPPAPAARRFVTTAGVSLGLSGQGDRSGSGPTVGFSTVSPLERKLELELQVLGALGSEETSYWSGHYYPEGPVTGETRRRAANVGALIRLNYVFTGRRLRPYVSTGMGVGVSRVESLRLAYLESGEEFFSRTRQDAGIGITMLLAGGADIALGPRWRLRPELGWQGVGWTYAGTGGPALSVGVSYSPGGS